MRENPPPSPCIRLRMAVLCRLLAPGPALVVSPGFRLLLDDGPAWRELAELPLAAILYTDILRDGTRVGPNVEATARLAEEGGLPVLASGGVATLEDLKRLAGYQGIAGAIVGRALYEGVFTLEAAVQVAPD